MELDQPWYWAEDVVFKRASLKRNGSRLCIMRFNKVRGSILSIAAPRAPYFELHPVYHSARLGPYRASPSQLLSASVIVNMHVSVSRCDSLADDSMMYCICRYITSIRTSRRPIGTEEVEVKNGNTAAEDAVGVKRGSTFQAFRGAALAFYQPEFGVEGNTRE